jgi:ATP-dependent Clp protease adaptor protein ClpS
MNMSEQVSVKNQTKLLKPKAFAVVIHNDEITTMDFVVRILNKVFNKSLDEANSLMMEVHEKGKGVAGVYVLDIALTKKNQVDIMSIDNNFPLKVTVEEL